MRSKSNKTLVTIVGSIGAVGLLFFQLHTALAYRESSSGTSFNPRFDPALSYLAKAIEREDPNRVISIDWGLHNSLLGYVDPELHTKLVNLWGMFNEFVSPYNEANEKEIIKVFFAAPKTAVVSFLPHSATFPGTGVNFSLFVARNHLCIVKKELVNGANGKPLYILFMMAREVGNETICMSPEIGL